MHKRKLALLRLEFFSVKSDMRSYIQKLILPAFSKPNNYDKKFF